MSTQTHTHSALWSEFHRKMYFSLNFFWTSAEIKDAEMMTNYGAEPDFFLEKWAIPFRMTINDTTSALSVV